MDKLSIGKLLSIAILGYCRIFWNDDSIELKPTFRVRVIVTIRRLCQKILQALHLKIN